MDKYSYIKAEEGFRPKVYKDTRGIETIGYGQRVDELELDEEWAVMLLRRKANQHEAFLQHFPWWRDLNPIRQAALISMAYQLGDAGISEFRNFMRLLAEGNFSAAADEMLRSEWAKQTPNRAQRAADIVRYGHWPINWK